VDAVIWGYGRHLGYGLPPQLLIGLPIFDEDGCLRHRRGVTDVRGLYFLGLTSQWTR
jgi:hypothetical protein